jgi:hypothetical protein
MGLFGKAAGSAIKKYEDKRGDEDADKLLAHGTVTPRDAAHSKEVIEVFQGVTSNKDSLRVCVCACNLARSAFAHDHSHFHFRSTHQRGDGSDSGARTGHQI